MLGLWQDEVILDHIEEGEEVVHPNRIQVVVEEDTIGNTEV